MRAVVQKVKDANVIVDNLVVGEINYGILTYIAITHDDSNKDIDLDKFKAGSINIS